MPFTNSVDVLSAQAVEKFEEENYLFETFHENTKLNCLKADLFGREISLALRNKHFIEGVVNSYKTYTSADAIPLTLDFAYEKKDLIDIIERRRSCRQFESCTMNLKELSFILRYSYGINGSLPQMQGRPKQFVRPVPSAGALYPLEIYILPLSVIELKNNVYHYNVYSHLLEDTGISFKKEQLKDVTAYADEISNANVIIFITSMFHRNIFKYNNRGYRFIHLDAGHLAQNICLTSCYLGCSSLPLGGFYDDEVNDLLQIDGLSEAVIYEIAIGKEKM